MRKIPLRHRIIWTIIRPLVAVFLYFKFRYRYQKAKNLPDHYIVLSNHNTDFDPLFVAVSFGRQMYFVGSEHISRWKVAYPLLKWAFQPILRYKGTSAASTVMEMLRALRSGANVCMFPEGARSWNGVTAPILPSTPGPLLHPVMTFHPQQALWIQPLNQIPNPATHFHTHCYHPKCYRLFVPQSLH